MRLLFDENLAVRLATDLSDIYPASVHVLSIGLAGASDRAIWEHAGAHGFVLVTKDEDFHRLSALIGPPPKVIWICLGNCATSDVAQLLRSEVDTVREFVQHEEAAFLALGRFVKY